MPKQESLEATSENIHRGYGHDMLGGGGATVPSASSSNREDLITNDGWPCMTESPCQVAAEVSPGLKVGSAMERSGEVLSHADTCTREQRA